MSTITVDRHTSKCSSIGRINTIFAQGQEYPAVAQIGLFKKLGEFGDDSPEAGTGFD